MAKNHFLIIFSWKASLLLDWRTKLKNIIRDRGSMIACVYYNAPHCHTDFVVHPVIIFEEFVVLMGSNSQIVHKSFCTCIFICVWCVKKCRDSKVLMNDKQIPDNHFISVSKLGHCWAVKLRMIHFCSGLCRTLLHHAQYWCLVSLIRVFVFVVWYSVGSDICICICCVL